MNIIYVTNYFPPGINISSTNVYKIVKMLAQKGHNILVLTLGSQNSQNNNFQYKFVNISANIQVMYSNSFIRYPLSFFYSHFENLIQYIRKLKNKFVPHVIISQYHTFHFAPIAASLLAKILKIPYIIRTHDIFSPYHGKLQKYGGLVELAWYKTTARLTYNSIKYGNLCYVASTEALNHMKHLKKFQKSKEIFKLNHNGVDFNEIFPKIESNLKEKYGCENIFLYMGHLDIDHGVNKFISAIPIINREEKDTHFIILGSGRDKLYCKQEVKKLNIEKYVHFIDPIPHSEVNSYVNNMDLGIGYLTDEVAYRYNVPIKILEYMACKKTFITTRVSKDVIHNDNTGLTIKSMDSNDVAKKTIKLLQDSGLRRKLGETGYNIIKKNFQWKRIMDDFEGNMMKLVQNFKID